MADNGLPWIGLDCFVSLGMFRNERSVRIPLPDGREIATVVDRGSVVMQKEPTSMAEEVPGIVRVFIVSDLNDDVIVDLPQPGITEGPRIQVPRHALKEAA